MESYFLNARYATLYPSQFPRIFLAIVIEPLFWKLISRRPRSKNHTVHDRKPCERQMISAAPADEKLRIRMVALSQSRMNGWRQTICLVFLLAQRENHH